MHIFLAELGWFDPHAQQLSILSQLSGLKQDARAPGRCVVDVYVSAERRHEGVSLFGFLRSRYYMRLQCGAYTPCKRLHRTELAILSEPIYKRLECHCSQAKMRFDVMEKHCRDELPTDQLVIGGARGSPNAAIGLYMNERRADRSFLCGSHYVRLISNDRGVI